MKFVTFLLLILGYSGVSIGDNRKEDDILLRGSNSRHSLASNISHFNRPKNPPKYFAIDVDGTLYTTDKDAMNKNIEAFAEARRKGYIPFLCTGNMFYWAQYKLGNEFRKKTGYNGYPGIYDNGSLIYDENGNRLIPKRAIAIPFISLGAYRIINKYKSYTSGSSGESDSKLSYTNKASAIAKLMKHLNLTPEDCAFVGNEWNDVEAMDLSDISFAVGNAPDDIKKHAKWVLDKDYDQGGVAETLKLTYGL